MTVMYTANVFGVEGGWPYSHIEPGINGLFW